MADGALGFERKFSGQFVGRVFAEVEGALAQSLLRAGIDVKAPREEISVEQFAQGLSLYSRSRFPELSVSEGMRRVGFETVRRSKGKYDGKTLDEALSISASALSRVGPFLEPQVHAHGERHYVAHFDDVAYLHTFFLGVLEGVTSSTHPNVKVKWSPEGLSGARYDVTFS